MKTVDLSMGPLSASQLFDMARQDILLVKTQQGDAFFVSCADEFQTEVEILRRNHHFLNLLDRFKEDRETIPLDQVAKELG